MRLVCINNSRFQTGKKVGAFIHSYTMTIALLPLWTQIISEGALVCFDPWFIH